MAYSEEEQQRIERQRRKEEISKLKRISANAQAKLAEITNGKYTLMSSNGEALLCAEISRAEEKIKDLLKAGV
jgi:hypothetical protein